MLLFPPIIIKAKWFVLIYAGVGLYAEVTGTLAGITPYYIYSNFVNVWINFFISASGLVSHALQIQ